MKRSLKKPLSIGESISLMLGVIAIIGSYFAVPPFLNQFARAGDLKKVETKADMGLSEDVRRLITDIGLVESKIKAGKGTRYDHEQLKYLREKFEQLQKTQRGGS
jgi:hypothetical protein